MTAVPFSRAPSSTSPSPTASRLCSNPNPASPMASDNFQHSVPVLSTASGFQVLPGCFQPSEAGSTSPAQVRLHEGSSLLADDPLASDSPSSALCSRAPNSMPPARVRLHGGSSLLADDPSASDLSPWPRAAPPQPWTAPLGLGPLPSVLVPGLLPSASDSPPSASDCYCRPQLPLGLGQPPSASVPDSFSCQHGPTPTCSHSKCPRAWKWWPFSSFMQPFKVFTCMEVGAIIIPSPCSHLPGSTAPLSLSLSLSLLRPRTGVESSDSPGHGRPRSPCSRPWLPPVPALGAGIWSSPIPALMTAPVHQRGFNGAEGPSASTSSLGSHP